MTKIRLQRIGRRNLPYYRVVVTDSHNGPKSGRFIEILGSYNPKEGKVEINKERAEYWLSQGSQTSGTVHNFLVDQGVVKGKKLNVLPKKSPTKKRNAPDEPEPAAEAAPETSAAEEAAPETPAEEPAPSEVEEVKEEAPAAEQKTEEVTDEEPTEDKKEAE